MFFWIFGLFKSMPVVFAATCTGKNLFFFLPVWYKYLLPDKMNSACQLTDSFHFPNDIWLIALAVLDMLIRIAGFVAVISIIISGIMYITSTGEPEKAASARRRLTNSLIGLAIALVATSFVAFIGNKLK